MRELGIIQDGALLIVDGKIAEVGPSRRLERLSAAKDAYDLEATGKVVMPAFVDCHTRLLCAPTGCEDFAAASKMVHGFSSQRMEMEARKRLREFVRCGTTTVLAGCGYAIEEAAERKALRVLQGLDERPIRLRASYFGALRHGGHCANPEAAMAALAGISEKGEAMAVAVSDRPSRAAAERFAAAAIERGLRVFLESPDGEPVTGTAALVGLERLQPANCASVAAWGIPVVLLPGESYQFGGFHFAPARELIDAGAPLALATGYDHLLSPTASMAMIQSIACTQMKMTPAEAITASTINAAWAMGMANEVGSLEVGKAADVLVLQSGDYRDVALHFGLNPVAAVVHNGDGLFPRMEGAD